MYSFKQLQKIHSHKKKEKEWLISFIKHSFMYQHKGLNLFGRNNNIYNNDNGNILLMMKEINESSSKLIKDA